MQFTSGLNMYWTAPDQAQIGLDPRTGVVLDGLSSDELKLIDSLSLPQTRTDFFAGARRRNISQQRAELIIDMLSDAGVLGPGEVLDPDASAHWRLHRSLPESRNKASVLLARGDHFGVEIIRILAQSGLGTAICTDDTPVGVNDHPAMQRLGFGQPRHLVLRTVLRELSSSIQTVQQEHPSIVLLTGQHSIDPFLSNDFLANGIPAFHAWVEEYDVIVGPLTVPHMGTCASCIYLHRSDTTATWTQLGPQAMSAPSMAVESSTLTLAAGLAARDILNFVDLGGTRLSQHVWRIGPQPDLPSLSTLAPHPRCGCYSSNVTPQSVPNDFSHPTAHRE